MAAGRHEGFGAGPVATRTHDQRVMAPLTMSSMGARVSQQPAPSSPGREQWCWAEICPSDAQLCEFIFAGQMFFSQSRELLGAAPSSFAFTMRSGWKGCTEPDQPLALPLLPPQGQPGHSSCKTVFGQLPRVFRAALPSRLATKNPSSSCPCQFLKPCCCMKAPGAVHEPSCCSSWCWCCQGPTLAACGT